MTDPNWFPDPTGRFELRYFDGAQWTAHVATEGVTSTDPLVDVQQTVAVHNPTPTQNPTTPAHNPSPPPGLTSAPHQSGDASGGSSGGNTGVVLAFVGVLAVLAALAIGGIFLLRGDDGDSVATGSDSTADTTEGEATTSTAAATTVSEPTTTIATESTTTLGQVVDAPAATDPSTAIGEYGSDSTLDGLADDCQSADFQACDELFLTSDSGSGYEAYGDTCGGRNEPDTFCILLYGG